MYRYFSGLLKQFKQKIQPPPLRIGKNFFPSATLKPQERRSLLQAREYSSLLRSEAVYKRAAKRVRLVLNPMNGGIGTSLNRDAHLKKIWKILGKKGPVKLGAKGSDLYFQIKLKGKSGYISISEAKILRAIHERKLYAKIVIQQLVSSETAASVRGLFKSPNIFHRLGIRSPWGRKTYAQILSKTSGLGLKPALIQSALPTIDASGKLSRKRLAPGGHGHWGAYFLLEALKAVPSKQPEIHAIYNEDGINNLVDPVIVGWMAKENVPVVMLSTTKTDIDKKGGLLGIQRHDVAVTKEIFEEAQAKEAGQMELFTSMGLTAGEAGAQYFNTNTALINYAALAPLIKDLLRALGRKKIEEIVAPKLIRNVKKQEEGGKVKSYVQLEGALGSSLLNLDGFLMTSEDERVKNILKRRGMVSAEGQVKFLGIVNAGTRYRVRFFTPVKTAEDFWLQFKSGAFRFNVKNWTLEPTSRKDLQAPPATPSDLI